MTARSPRIETRSNARPRWAWSGAEKLVAPSLPDETVRLLYELLGNPRSSIEEVGTKIRELGARYHRYLHQDEFGPSRAERMSALRALRAQILKLDSIILELPEHLALDLMKTFDNEPSLQSWAIGQIYDAAEIDLSSRHSHHSAQDLKVLESICAAAETAIALISSLDTNSESELLTDTLGTGLLMVKDAFSVVDAPLSALKAEVTRTLARLRRQSGAEKESSIWWLVYELCDLWTQETGRPVSNSAFRQGVYTGRPESPAGKFVLAVIEVLRPSDPWMGEHLCGDAPVRARKVAAPGAHQAGTVYFAMRKYVADHRPSTARRGRPRAPQ